MKHLSEFFGDIPEMCVHYFQMLTNFVYVCQSVRWVTSLLKLDKCRVISSSGWDIFLKFFGNIPAMLVHWFQIIQFFLHICHSGSWHTSFLELDRHRDISSFWLYIFLKSFGDIPRTFLIYFQIVLNFLYVCQSVSWLVGYFLTDLG